MRASRGFSAVAGLTPCEAASVVRTAVSGSRMRELVLVRHGESEGNVAYQRSKMGDASMYSGEFLRRHSGQWRLTDQGIEQAEAAGAWLRAHYPEGFERLYVPNQPYYYHQYAETVRAKPKLVRYGFDMVHRYTVGEQFQAAKPTTFLEIVQNLNVQVGSAEKTFASHSS